MIIFNVTNKYKFKNQTRIDKKVYQLYMNNEKTNYFARRITSLSDIYLNFIYSKNLDYNEVYFMYRPKAFFTYFFKMEVDLVFVDNQGFVIEHFENFDRNSITKKIENAKFVYIFKSNALKNVEIKEDEKFKIIHRRSRKHDKVVFTKMNI